MLRGLIVLAVLVVALLRGGSLRRFAAVELRALPLVFGGLALQLLIFTPFRSEPLVTAFVPVVYLASMVLVLGWVWLNRHLPGISLVLVGVAMNTAAIVANGGYMPVMPLAAEYAGRSGNYASAGDTIANNSLATEGSQLWLLTDIFPVPAGIPLANVFSLGDILLTIGVCLFCYRVMLGAPTSAEPVRVGAHNESVGNSAAQV